MKQPTFRQFIASLIDRYGTADELARLIRISPSAFSRGVRHGSFGSEKLLLLAEAVGESPDRVLRIAGKASMADAIDRLYRAPNSPLSREDRELIALDVSTKRQILRLLDSVAGKDRP